MTPAERIRAARRKQDEAHAEIEAVAREFVPGYHFLDSRVSTFWTCEDSPIGYCVFRLLERNGRLIEGDCRYCGQPTERK